MPGIMAEKNIEPVDVYEVVRDHMEKSCHRCRGDKVYRFMSESGAAGDWYLEKARGYGFVPEVIAMKSNSDHFRNYVHVVELLARFSKALSPTTATGMRQRRP